MIQDIAPHQFSNEYRPQPPDKDSYILHYCDSAILVDIASENEINFPTFGELAVSNEKIYNECSYLFTIDHDRYYLKNNLNYQGMFYQMAKLEVLRDAKPLHRAFAGDRKSVV